MVGGKGDSLPTLLQPAFGDCGLLSDDREIARRSVRAWQLFADLGETVDMYGPTRSHGNRARDLLMPLGDWPDSRHLADMVADAQAERAETEPQSLSDRRLRASHRTDSDAAIREAVHRAVAAVREWYRSGAAGEQAHLVTPSPLGPVPIGTLVHAAAFHLALTARDLRPAGAPDCPELDELGVVAVVDGAGAVAARLGATVSVAAYTGAASAGAGSEPGRWRTVVAPAGTRKLGPAVQGPAGTLVDVAGGRVELIQVARHVRLKHPRRLVDASIVLDGIPELPAAAMLRRAAAFARALPF